MAPVSPETLTPERIMQVGLGFWASKALLSAVEMELFTELAKGSRSCDELQARIEQLGDTDCSRRAPPVLGGRRCEGARSVGEDHPAANRAWRDPAPAHRLQSRRLSPTPDEQSSLTANYPPR